MGVSLERLAIERRRKSISHLTGKGASAREISEILGISARTVDRHRRRTALSLSSEGPMKPKGSPNTPDERYYNQLHTTPSDWEAACQGYDPEMWFPDPTDHKARIKAKAICNTCPGKAKCLQWAFDADERYGIWGGLSQNERTKITGKR